jgi:hypothetical protein
MDLGPRGSRALITGGSRDRFRAQNPDDAALPERSPFRLI